MKSINHNIRKIFITGVILTTTIFFYTCANMANYGRNQLSNEARNKFEDFQVLPDHNYYYSGSNVKPDALIAIHKSYTLTSADRWTKVDPASKDIKFFVQTMQRSFSDPPYGYNILDPKGKLIGFYYSKFDPWPAQMEGENTVWISPPDKQESSRGPRLMGGQE